MKSSSLQDQLKKINFGAILDSVHDQDIIWRKFNNMVNLSTTFLKHISCLYNAIHSTALDSLKGYIEEQKGYLAPFREYLKSVKESQKISGEEENKILFGRFKDFYVSPLIENVMYSYNQLLVKGEDINEENNDWILSSTSTNCPFKGCGDISLFTLYKRGKDAINTYLPLIYKGLSDFYNVYVLPNFDLTSTLTSISEILNKLHASKKVQCNLIAPYICKLACTEAFDIQSLNLQYLQSNNDSFIMTVFEKLMQPNPDIVVNKKLAGQMKNIMVFLQANVGASSPIAGTIKIGAQIIRDDERKRKNKKKQEEEEGDDM